MLSKTKQAFDSVSKEASKFVHKDYLHASVSAAVLVAYADGSISSDEKSKMINMITHTESLASYDTSEIIEHFNKLVSVFDFDLDVGRGTCFDEVGKMTGKVSESNSIVRLATAVANSEGCTQNQVEMAVVEKIKQELNV